MKGELVPQYPHATAELVAASGVPALMLQIRPAWQAKGLIDRVRRLLPIDPSSACQRILNAAFHDLREKIQIAGIDIASEVASANKLPPVTKPEDVENYGNARTLDLAYRMGLLTRADWRRLTRAYEIRRDLEHEDVEYEAGIEDVIYVFTTSIEAVLSRDPIMLVKVSEIKEIIEATGPAIADTELLEDFEHAPDTRQLEILKFLVSKARDEGEPDLVRANAYTLLGSLTGLTHDSVKVALAKHVQEQLGRVGLTELDVRIANQAGVFPYLRLSQRRAFFRSYISQLNRVGSDWRSHASHGELLSIIDEFGGLAVVTDKEQIEMVKWLTLCYLGEPGGYGMGVGRAVFYSNPAAPIIAAQFRRASAAVKPILVGLESDQDVTEACGASKHVAARFDQLLDVVE